MRLVRTIQLAVSMFPPFSLALVVWTTFYLVVMLLAFVVMAGLRMSYGELPVIGPLFQFGLPLSFLMVAHFVSIHLYLTGIKLGLTALGIEPERSEMQMLAAAFAYGVLEAIIVLSIYSLMTAIYVIAQIQEPMLVALQFTSLTDPIAEISRSMAIEPVTPILPIFVSFSILMLRTAMLPVLAGTVAGRSTTGRLHVPFGGFGQDFVFLFLLLCLITAASTLIALLFEDASQYVGLATTLTDQIAESFGEVLDGEARGSVSLSYALVVLGVICISIWLFSLQCAGTALAYRDQVAEIATQAKTEASQRRLKAHGEAGDLLRSRMPKF